MIKKRRIIKISIVAFVILCWMPVLLIFFYSKMMRTNRFCFDYDKKEVYTRGFSIYDMRIEKVYGGYVHWQIVDYTKTLTKIDLNDFNIQGYEVYKEDTVFTIDNKFFPNSCYRIINEGGSAGSATISFCTDSFGNLINKEDCFCDDDSGW